MSDQNVDGRYIRISGLICPAKHADLSVTAFLEAAAAVHLSLERYEFRVHLLWSIMTTEGEVDVILQRAEDQREKGEHGD